MKRVPARFDGEEVRTEACPLGWNRECWHTMSVRCEHANSFSRTTPGPVTVLCSAPSKKGEK